MLPAGSRAIAGLQVSEGKVEIVFGAVNEAPPSTERLKVTWKFPARPSHQTLLILPAESTATCPSNAPPLLDTLTGVENVAPPSLDRLKNRILGTKAPDQVTSTLPAESTAMDGPRAPPLGWFEIIIGTE